MRGVRLSEDQKAQALQLYLQGKTYAEIYEETGVSEAAMTAVVAERAEEDPDASVTHELARKLREKRVAPEKLLRGVAVDDALEAMGSNLDEVEKDVLPVVRKFGDKTAEVCKKATEYDKVVKETGHTHDQLLTEHSKKARELKEVSEAVSARASELESLDQKTTTARSGLDHLVDLERIKKGLEKIGKTPRQAAATIEKVGEILDSGLTMDVLVKMSIETKRLGAKVTNIPRRVAELLDKYGSLDNAVVKTEKKLSTLGREEKKLRRSVGSLKDQETFLVNRRRDLRVNLKGLRSEYNGLSRIIKDRESQSEERVAMNEAASRDAIRSRREAVEAEILSKRKEEETRSAARQAEQERSLAARSRSFQTQMDDEGVEYQKKFDAMDKYYKGVEYTHKEILSSLGKQKLGLEGEIIKLREERDQMAAANGANRALSGFLWKNEPAKMTALLAISSKENANSNAPLSSETRTFLLDAVLGIALEDARFWPESAARYMTNPQRSLVGILKHGWAERDSLAIENRDLAAALANQREALENGYPTWKILDNDPAFLGRFLGSRDDKYLVAAFRHIPYMQTVRVGECLKRADEIQDRDIDGRAEALVMNVAFRFTRGLMGRMEGLGRLRPVYLQSGPTRSSIVKASRGVSPSVDNPNKVTSAKNAVRVQSPSSYLS